MKIVLLCLIVTCSTYVGFGFSSYYRRRVKFFSDCISFQNKMVVEIAFKQNKLKEIIDEFIKRCGIDFKFVLKSFEENYLLGKNVLEESMLFKKNICLSKEEKEIVYAFFKTLGRYDSENQIKEIENFKKTFESSFADAQAENKKYSSLYVKLGLMAGLLVAILLF